MRPHTLAASVEVSATGEAGFASATATASVEGSATQGSPSSATFTLSPGTCKLSSLVVDPSFGNTCRTSKEVGTNVDTLDGHGHCAPEVIGGYPNTICTHEQTNAFISACGLLPAPSSPPSAGASSAASSTTTWLAFFGEESGRRNWFEGFDGFDGGMRALMDLMAG